MKSVLWVVEYFDLADQEWHLITEPFALSESEAEGILECEKSFGGDQPLRIAKFVRAA